MYMNENMCNLVMNIKRLVALSRMIPVPNRGLCLSRN